MFLCTWYLFQQISAGVSLSTCSFMRVFTVLVAFCRINIDKLSGISFYSLFNETDNFSLAVFHPNIASLKTLL